MARLSVRNGHQKDTCFNKVGLCAQNIDTIECNWELYVKRERESSLRPRTTFASQL